MESSNPYVDYIQGVVTNPRKPFAAWACDRLGFIYCDLDVVAWHEDPTSCVIGSGDECFETVRVVTGTASIVDINDTLRLHAPESFRTVDLWVEWEVSGLDPDDMLERWQQARLLVTLLNTHAEQEAAV